jgi:hypothetical protein
MEPCATNTPSHPIVEHSTTFAHALSFLSLSSLCLVTKLSHRLRNSLKQTVILGAQLQLPHCLDELDIVRQVGGWRQVRAIEAWNHGTFRGLMEVMALPSATTLDSLIVHGHSTVDDAGMYHRLLREFCVLRTLDISDSRASISVAHSALNMVESKLCAQALTTLTCLRIRTDVGARGWTALTAWPCLEHLTTLGMGLMDLDKESMDAFCAVLRHASHLKSFELYGFIDDKNEAGPAFLAAIVRALPDSLESLEMSTNSCRGNSTVDRQSAVWKAIATRSFPHLTNLAVFGFLDAETYLDQIVAALGVHAETLKRVRTSTRNQEALYEATKNVAPCLELLVGSSSAVRPATLRAWFDAHSRASVDELLFMDVVRIGVEHVADAADIKCLAIINCRELYVDLPELHPSACLQAVLLETSQLHSLTVTWPSQDLSDEAFLNVRPTAIVTLRLLGNMTLSATGVDAFLRAFPKLEWSGFNRYYAYSMALTVEQLDRILCMSPYGCGQDELVNFPFVHTIDSKLPSPQQLVDVYTRRRPR